MSEWINKCHFGDCLETLQRMPNGIVNTCVTSPPYFGLRDYGNDGQIGLEATPDEFIAKLVAVFREVRRVLRDDGTLWLNIGDSYANNTSAGDKTFGNPEFNKNRPSRAATKTASKSVPYGCKPKDLIGIPWLLAFALRADGWYLRQDIIWHKPNPMPESVQDRCTKAHEYIFLLSKSERYYYDAGAIAEPSNPDYKSRYDSDFTGRPGLVMPDGKAQGIAIKGSREWKETRNKRSVWTVTTKPYTGAHFAVFPTELIEPCILAGAPVGGVVLDPFFGSGTTGQVAQALGRKYIGCELNANYKPLQDRRLEQPSFEFAEAASGAGGFAVTKGFPSV
jgi:hypothetical protein